MPKSHYSGLDGGDFAAIERGVPLAPVTGFFGANSSGKTSLLQIVLLLKQTVESTDRTIALDLGDERSLVRLGTFPDILFEHDVEAS